MFNAGLQRGREGLGMGGVGWGLGWGRVGVGGDGVTQRD